MNGEGADEDVGQRMHELLRELFPICRSLTGNGVRQTLAILKRHLPLELHEVPSGTAAFDWNVPKEWNIRDAFIADEQGNKVVDFKVNNLHVVGYSTPIDRWMTLAELQPYLYSIEDQPDAIPYVTSYYRERWGFCIAHNERLKLKDGRYRVFIDSDLKDGHLTYAEMVLPGSSAKEILISTYFCHPSMANNELSGPVVSTFLAKWIQSRPHRYTYRFVYTPETIGSIVYLSRNLGSMKQNTIAGFNLSCIGDERGYSYVASRYGNTLADRVAHNVLTHAHPEFICYSFLERGSDERQYGSPGVDLPLVTLCRSKFGRYPEYHTSLDDMNLVTPSGLKGGYEFVRSCVELIERNRTYRVTCRGEPQLGKRNLYPDLSTKTSGMSIKSMMNFIAYADGDNDLVAISDRIGVAAPELYPIADRLAEAGLVTDVDVTS